MSILKFVIDKKTSSFFMICCIVGIIALDKSVDRSSFGIASSESRGYIKDDGFITSRA